MTDARVIGFAELLANADETERNALFARAKMEAMNIAEPQAFEPPIETLGRFIARDIPIPPVLVEPRLVVRGGIACTVGRAGKGKTQVNLNRIIKWAAGKPLFEDLKSSDGNYVLGPSGPLKTLIIENEGAAGMFHDQITTMVGSKMLAEKDRKQALENVLIWGDGGYSGLKLDEEASLGMVRAGCEKWEPDIVFIEPFRGLWSGEENSSTDMAKVADALSSIASDFDCGVILTHHERKSGAGEDGEKMSAGRGSTVLEGVVATMENFEVAKGGDYRELSWSKVRYSGGVKILPIRMEWQPSEFWYKHVPLHEIESGVLTALAEAGDALTLSEIANETDEPIHKVRKMVKDLAELGKVKKLKSVHTGTGSTGDRYRLAMPTGEPDGGEGMDF